MFKSGNEKGSTMLETITYIGFLGMLGAVLASYAGSVFSRYKTGRLTQQILEIRKAVVNFTAADESYSNLNLEAMKEAKALPFDMLQGYHIFSGAIRLGVVDESEAKIATNAKYLFYVTFDNVPRKACAELLTQGQFYSDGADLDTLIVNDRTAWNYPKSFYNAEIITSNITTLNPIDNAATGIRPDAGAALNACRNRDDNKITWIFS